VDKMAEVTLLEPEAGVKVAAEILRWLQLHRWLGFQIFELIIERLQHEWYPAEPALNRHELEPWKAVEHASVDDVAHHPTIVEEQHRADHGRHDSTLERGPRRAFNQLHRLLGCANMEVDREVTVLAKFPKGRPVVAAEIGQGVAVGTLVEMGIGVDIDATQTGVGHAFGLAHRKVDIPPG